MDKAVIVERLRRILRREIAECEQAIRARDPVRALNDLADAAKALKSLVRSLETESGDVSPISETMAGDSEPD